MSAKPALLLSVAVAGIWAGCARKAPEEAPVARSVAEVPPAPGGSSAASRAPVASPRPRPAGDAGIAMPGPAGCTATCDGTASRELVRSIAEHTRLARGCYNRALAVDPTLQGGVTVRLELDPNGAVCSSTVTSHTFPDDAVPTCIAQRIGAASDYPAPTGGCVTIDIPIKFVPP